MNHQLFISIRKNFIKLLKDGNNSYKYVRQYREKINKYIEEDITKTVSREPCESGSTILKQLLYMLLTIYSEKEKCRFHTNDDIAAKIEKVIIIDALKILKEDKYKEQKIVEINEILIKEIDEFYFILYKTKYGFSANINTDNITEITDKNVKDIYINFNSVRKLLQLTEHLNDKHKEIDDYLFCLYYFSKSPEFEIN
jgi:hypothetical protein